MDDELGAVAASERSELAVTVTSLAVHWIGLLGSLLLVPLKLRYSCDWGTSLIPVKYAECAVNDFGAERTRFDDPGHSRQMPEEADENGTTLNAEKRE